MLNPCNTHARQHKRADFTPPEDWWKLPGYVEAGTTYESHTFWVEWTHGKWHSVARPTARIWVEHGAGVESIEVDHHFARPLRDMFTYGNTFTAAAFQLCWGVFDLARGTARNERIGVKQDIFQAFADGRLKKRKNRGRTSYKVWIEPAQETLSLIA